jgi:hypothetical protein
LQHAGKRTISTLSVIALVPMSVLIWAGNQEYRWQCFLDVLSREPGIQVTHHERGWGRSRVQGIRSSEARDPVALATSLGLDADTLGLNFKISSFPAGALTHHAEMQPLGENQISAAPLAGAEAEP